MENNNQDWINEMNKKLEEQRANYKRSIESGEVAARIRSSRNSAALKTRIANNVDFQSIAGKAGGKIRGAIQGKLNAENGHLEKHRAKAVKNRIESVNKKLQDNAKAFYDLIETTDWFVLKDVQHLTSQLGYKNPSSAAFKLIKLLDLYEVVKAKSTRIPTLYKKR